MSIVRCHYHDKNIDTDFEAEHFKYGTEECASINVINCPVCQREYEQGDMILCCDPFDIMEKERTF